jgi:hypothetical protein
MIHFDAFKEATQAAFACVGETLDERSFHMLNPVKTSAPKFSAIHSFHTRKNSPSNADEFSRSDTIEIGADLRGPFFFAVHFICTSTEMFPNTPSASPASISRHSNQPEQFQEHANFLRRIKVLTTVLSDPPTIHKYANK